MLKGAGILLSDMRFDKEMAKRGYITVDKGSVTVNGVSLTVCNPTEDTFQVAIILILTNIPISILLKWEAL